MPELPEVERICRYLRPRLVGRTIVGARNLGLAPLEGRALAGARIASVERRAKLVLVGLDDGRTLAFHLKMTGKLWVDAVAAGRATRAVFDLDRGGALRFEDVRRFGWARILDRDGRARVAAGFGPDGLEADEGTIAAALLARRGRLKPALLDQRVVAGIGNIYADEILFDARLHPLARLDALGGAAVRRLARSIRRVLRRALALREEEEVPDQERVGSGRRGVAARLGPRVYQRTGEPCRRCRTAIARIVVGGRATHLCPRCQGLD